MKKFFLSILIFSSIIPSVADAKGARQFIGDIIRICPGAEKTEALRVASRDLDLSTIHCFVVLKQGGIPAERATHFINWGEYDYRGVNVDLEIDSATTRRGSVYTYLKKGDILAVAEVFSMGRKIYFKLITPEVYVPENRQKDKRHSRVTLNMIFKIPKKVRNTGNAEEAIKLIEN